MRRHLRIPVLILTSASLLLWGCASSQKKPEEDPVEKQMQELKATLAALNARLDGMETKFSSLNDKVDATRTSVDNLLHVQKPKPAPVESQASEGMGEGVETPLAPTDPETGYTNDSAVKSYRQAMIQFQAQKYPETVLAFSNFLERYADHPLAGAAQFYVGECYLRQKEYKLAVQEFQRVLTSYDRSPFIADTLKEISIAEDALKKPEDAAKHRQMLLSLFPQSPAAGGTTVESPSERKPGTEKSPPSTEAETSGKIKHAVTEVISKMGTAPALDEPPPTAPMTEQRGAAPETKHLGDE